MTKADVPSKAKVLFVDVETAPSLGWAWSKWETNIIDFKVAWYMLSFAYKWQGESSIHVAALPDYALFKKDKENDRELVTDLWKLFDEADIVIAHNGDRFDIPKASTRFIAHGLKPPSPFKTIDTCKIARRLFKFDSNKLDDLGRYLGVGRKLPNTGFDLWRRCMVGDLSAWSTMCRYNIQDVALLERVYLKLRAWDTTHPPVAPGQPETCPKCGSKDIQKEGFAFTAYRKRQRYSCKRCKGWFSGPAKGLDK